MFFQNIIIVNKHLKLWSAELVHHSHCCLSGKDIVATFGRLLLHVQTNNKKPQTVDGFQSMSHCSFLDCVSLWGKKQKYSLQIEPSSNINEVNLVSQNLQWNRIEYYVNHLVCIMHQYSLTYSYIFYK